MCYVVLDDLGHDLRIRGRCAMPIPCYRYLKLFIIIIIIIIVIIISVCFICRTIPCICYLMFLYNCSTGT